MIRPHAGEPVSGDSVTILSDGRRMAVALADGLGHGPAARDSAELALEAARTHLFGSLEEGLRAAHHALRGSAPRGAVLGLAVFDPAASTVTFAGVGNIDLILVDEAIRRLVAQHGFLGGTLPRVRTESAPFPAGSLALLVSDGIAAAFDPRDYQGLKGLTAQALAEAIVRERGRQTDDAAAVVVARR